MRIAFHIRRLSWYRILASTIEEALRQGHFVECWHNIGARELNANCPSLASAPAFTAGKPRHIPYVHETGLSELMRRNEVEAVVDVVPPPKECVGHWPNLPARPYWVVMDGPPVDSLLVAETSSQLRMCDMFAMKTPVHVAAVVSMKTRSWEELQLYLSRYTLDLGEYFVSRFAAPLFAQVWSDSDVQYFMSRAAIVGTPMLDDIQHVDPEEVRKRWGIQLDQPVIAIYPCPFGSAYGAAWEKLFVTVNRIPRLAKIMLSWRTDLLRQAWNATTDRDVINALADFCRRQGAVLVVKNKHHSMIPVPGYLARHAYKVISQDTFLPHTALELFRIAQLTVGYYSSGAIEAVACGCSYLNVDLPGFPREAMLTRLYPIFDAYLFASGVTYNQDARSIVTEFSRKGLDDFCMDPVLREQYLEKHVGPLDGRCATRFLFAVEELIRMGPGLARDYRMDTDMAVCA